jgi:DNA-directed RNA polymerase specialized sigma24 family protein
MEHAFKEPEHEAFEWWLKHALPRGCQFLRHLRLPEPPYYEDVVQEVLKHFIAYSDGYRNQQIVNTKGWVKKRADNLGRCVAPTDGCFAISCKRKYLDMRRSVDRQLNHIGEYYEHVKERQAARSATSVLFRDIQLDIEEILSDKLLTVYRLRFIQDLPLRECADAMGVSQSEFQHLLYDELIPQLYKMEFDQERRRPGGAR